MDWGSWFTVPGMVWLELQEGTVQTYFADACMSASLVLGAVFGFGSRLGSLANMVLPHGYCHAETS